MVTLYNKLNYPAEFTWAPNLGEKGTAFSIRPATGMFSSCRLSSGSFIFPTIFCALSVPYFFSKMPFCPFLFILKCYLHDKIMETFLALSDFEINFYVFVN